MHIRSFDIPGPLIIETPVFRDSRGVFLELHNRRELRGLGLNLDFVQDNCSSSRKGVIRGLHYQDKPSQQGKLACVLSGRVLDVAVDVRVGSPTYGKHIAVELKENDGLHLWIPPGFAHGLSTLSDGAIFFYKCTAYYSPEHARSINFADPDLGIDWKVANPVLSPGDQKAPFLKDLEPSFHFKDSV